MSPLLEQLSHLHGWPVYAVVTTFIFLETAAFVGLLLPGELALVLAGVLAARGNLSPWLLGVLAFVAAVAGDVSAFSIGRRLGPRLQTTRLGRRLNEGRFRRAQDLLARRGAVAVVTGRWVGVLRTIVPSMAGVAGLSWQRFMAADLVAASTWVAGCIGVGYLARGSWDTAQSIASTATGVVLTLVVVLLIAAALVAWRRRSRTETPAQP